MSVNPGRFIPYEELLTRVLALEEQLTVAHQRIRSFEERLRYLIDALAKLAPSSPVRTYVDSEQDAPDPMERLSSEE
jgi:hypothetical protein